MRSTVAAVRASRAGWWSSLLSTSGPTLRCVVACAAGISGTNGSTAPTWSYEYSSSYPSDSTWRANSAISSGSSNPRFWTANRNGRVITRRSEQRRLLGSVDAWGAAPRDVVVHEDPRPAMDRRRSVSLQRCLVGGARVALVRVERPVRKAVGVGTHLAVAH